MCAGGYKERPSMSTDDIFYATIWFTVIAGVAFGLTGKNPVCRLITNAPEQGSVNKGLQQIDWVTILLMPVGADATGDPGEDMTGQMGNPDPGQDKEAHVVRQIPQVAFPVLLVPPDEGIPWKSARKRVAS